MSLKFKRRVIEINLYGKEKVVKYPTVEQWNSYYKEVVKEDADNFKAMSDFLCNLGLDTSDVASMEQEHLDELVRELTTKKK